MSQLRVAAPGRSPEFIDLGPSAHVPLHGHATQRGHAVSGGAFVRGRSGAAVGPARTAEGQREYRARRKAYRP